MYNPDDNFIPAGTTVEQRITSFKENMEATTETTDFGLKIKDRNIFYFLLLRDKLSSMWGFSFMIGDRVIIDYTKGTTIHGESN